ncbi:MAG: peptide-methionine (S)-S-oxide reductase MsrA [Acidobacteria bacterium]|nr:peptide-methionine (S)-S-oxide reductase MsrA [Acidobacteriota bacterium]
MAEEPQIAVFGGGCFWCTEAVFEGLKGVLSVMPGYAGGDISYPTYEQVCTGETGHAEAVRIEFAPSQISYRDLLTVFFATHDPTTLNRQGHDAGTQYRSIILYANEQQKSEAKDVIREISSQFRQPIVTEVKPLAEFYEAESYHRQYYRQNSEQPYCQFVISPKMGKLREHFQALLSPR